MNHQELQLGFNYVRCIKGELSTKYYVIEAKIKEMNPAYGESLAKKILLKEIHESSTRAL